MKKVLSTVAALGLVAGMATAAQALDFKVSGNYFLEGVYQSSGDGAGVALVEIDGDEAANDAFWRHEFIIRPEMQVNDKIAVKSKIYLANSGVDTDSNNGTWGTTDTDTANGGAIDLHHLFLEYKSPVGLVRMGRTSSGLWQGDFLSSDKNNNRLMYFPNWLPKPLGAVVFLQKSSEKDSNIADAADQDSDVYEAAVWYKTKDMRVALGYDYFDNQGTSSLSSTKHLIKGYYNQNFGGLYAESEFAYAWGENEYDNTVTTADTDIENFAIMADLGMVMNKLDVGILAFYASGDSDGAADGDLDAALSPSAEVNGLGEQFQPYTILTGATTGMLVGDYNPANGSMTAAGVISVGLHADFAVNDKLSLHSAVAYAEADDAPAGVDDEYGWEIDLGASYKLMDNLTYRADFGYLKTGDFFEAGTTTIDTSDVYVLNHRLSMTF